MKAILRRLNRIEQNLCTEATEQDLRHGGACPTPFAQLH
jgi:hypothetical protein